MTPLWYWAVATAVLAAVLAGVLTRRGAEPVSFVVYLAAVLLGDIAGRLWPEVFMQWWIWLLRQCLYDVLKLVVALELAYRAFHLFPGARATARVVFLLLLAVTTLSVAGLTTSGPPTARDTFSLFVLDVRPRLVNAALWLFVATSRLVLWFNLPVSDWHRAISLGFAAYMVLFVTVANLVRAYGLDSFNAWGDLDVAGYGLLCAYWAYAAWRPPEPSRLWAPFATLRRTA